MGPAFYELSLKMIEIYLVATQGVLQSKEVVRQAARMSEIGLPIVSIK